MRSLTRLLFARTMVAGSCLALWAGCSAKQQTEYVTGISTQVTVPRDLKSVVVEVSIGGAQQFCRAYRVYDGKVQLPRSLGTYAQNNTTDAITYTVIGISEAYTDSSPNPLFDGTCTNLTIGQNNARILRRSRQPYIPEQTLFLPLPLKYSCVDKNCPDDQTCKGGKCVSATVADPAKTFPRYTPDLSDGTGGTCFHVNAFKAPDGTTDIPGCMTGALPAIPVDVANCVYAVPLTASAPAAAPGQTSPFTPPATPPVAGSNEGVNVEVSYEGGFTREILDTDPDEGFTIPDPAFPQRFQLAPGLCDMVNGKNGAIHTITNIRTSGTCQAKRLAQPLCAADQLTAMGLDSTGVAPGNASTVAAVTKLVPPKSALMLVIDDTTKHQRFFDAIGTPPTATENPVDNPDSFINPTVQAAVKHPAIATVDLGLVYAPGAGQSCDPTLQTGDIALGALQSTDLVTKISDHRTSTVTTMDVRLGAALDRAYAALRSAPANTYFKRNVLVFSNEFADTAACTPMSVLEAHNAATVDGIKTYVVQIVRDPDPTGTPAFNNLAAAGALPGETASVGYRVEGALAQFNKLLNDVATCTYDMGPASTNLVPDGPDDTLAYTNLADGAAVTIKAADFTVAGSRVTINGDACQKYRDAFAAASTFALKYAQPEAAAVPIFAQRMAR